MADQFGDKTHEATPHRRQKAREEGHVARSQDLSSAALLVGGIVVLLYWGGDVANYFANLVREYLGGEAWLTADRDFAVTQWNLTVFGLGKVLLPTLGVFMLIAVAAQIGQVGLLWLPEKMGMDLNRVNPLDGFKRIFSLSNVVRLSFGLMKIGLITGIALWCVWGHIAAVLGAVGMELPQIASLLADTTLWTALKIGAVLLVLALLDYFYQWWKHEQDLMMSTQEIREEMKDTQGDPQIIQRRKAAQRQLALTRLKTTIPKADVIVTNPTELAIGIQYDIETMAAPVVVAKGAGLVAQKIRRIALENKIPIVERKELARALYKNVEIGQAIPAEQYAAVAEVLRYVYQLTGKAEETLRKAEQDAKRPVASSAARRRG